MDSSTPGLFDLPADTTTVSAGTEPVSRGERRQQLIARRITTGTHPLGYIPIHPDAARERTGPGLRCGTCTHRQTQHHHGRTYPKCMFGDGTRVSGCESSDVRAWWPACHDHTPKESTP